MKVANENENINENKVIEMKIKSQMKGKNLQRIWKEKAFSLLLHFISFQGYVKLLSK